MKKFANGNNGLLNDGVEVLTENIDYIQKSKEDAITERMSDCFNDGVVGSGQFPIVDIYTNLVTVGPGLAYKDGERIEILSSDTTVWSLARAVATSIDGLGGTVLTPQSTGCVNVIIPPDGNKYYIGVAYLLTCDNNYPGPETNYSQHPETGKREYYKWVDGYKININTNFFALEGVCIGSARWSSGSGPLDVDITDGRAIATLKAELSTEIPDDAITTPKIANGAVTNAKLATDAVNTVNILNNAITTNKILDANVTQSKLADNAVSNGKIVDSAVTYPKIETNTLTSLFRKNRIRNANLIIAQKGDSLVTYRGTAEDGTEQIFDGWQWVNNASPTLNNRVVTRDTSYPSIVDGGDYSGYSMRISTTSATSPSASMRQSIRQYILWSNIKDLYGKQVTLSFWVKASQTGMYSVAFYNSANNIWRVETYTVDVINTWEKKIITLTLDSTIGGWGIAQGVGIVMEYVVNSGSDYKTSLTGWQTGTLKVANTSQVDLFNDINDYFYITRTQLEEGGNATALEFIPYEQEFERCCKYMVSIGDSGIKSLGLPQSPGMFGYSAGIYFAIVLPTAMLRTPTISKYQGYLRYRHTSGAYIDAALSATSFSGYQIRLNILTLVKSIPSDIYGSGSDMCYLWSSNGQTIILEGDLI